MIERATVLGNFSLASLLLVALVLVASVSHADHPAEPLPPEQVVTGMVDPGSEAGDAGRDAANVALWLPRNVIDYTFRGVTLGASLVADEQLVPRYREAVGAPKGGNFWVFPTLFVDTGSAFSVGARMIVDTEHVATLQRFGFGGTSDLVTESRVLFKGGREVPIAISLESYYEIESAVEYRGVGIKPEADSRNVFRNGRGTDVGLYTEQHVRGLGSMGIRLEDRMEFFLSGSIARRQARDLEDGGPETMTSVFDHERAPIAGLNADGKGEDTWIGYVEMAARFDSRKYRGKPTPGALIEAYTGGAHSTEGETVALMRFGTRFAGFIPVYRETNIFSPRLVMDHVLPLGGVPVPFNELARQPDFRGFDTRRDLLSVVTGFDYTWQMVKFMGSRLFFDVATVAEGVKEFSFDQIKDARYAGGVGLDFYTDTTLIAQIAVVFSPEGSRFLFSIGAPEGFGDRQHRD
jgi:hypothetical protein